jgi:Sortase (surface protein transpeptidase)
LKKLLNKNLPRGSKLFVLLLSSGLFISFAYLGLVHSNDLMPVVSKVYTPLGVSNILVIPSINTYSRLEEVGLTKDGDMGVPKGRENVAWYKGGPQPGEMGSAVIAGHYGWKDDEPAVFDNLHLLVAGDKIYVRREGGEVVTFVVRETRVYLPEEDATEVFVSNDGKSHLNLITCGGEWDKFSQSRSFRLVVFTDREEVAGV